MNTTQTTPPQDIRKVMFNYNEKKFAKTIARFTKQLLSEIKVAVWAPTKDGQFVNILTTDLSGEAFENLSKKAQYTTYEGHFLDLQKIGVA